MCERINKECALRWNVEKGFSTPGEHFLSKISELSLIKGGVTSWTTSNRQTTIHTRTQSCGQLRLPNSPHVHVIGLWEENLERTHADTRRMCRLHTERDQSYDFVAVRQQARHCTTCQIVPDVVFFFFSNREANRQSGGRQWMCQPDICIVISHF